MLEKKDTEINKLGEMMEIVIQHPELKIEDLNEFFIRIYNHDKKYYLLKLFCEEICYNSNNNCGIKNPKKNELNIKTNSGIFVNVVKLSSIFEFKYLLLSPLFLLFNSFFFGFFIPQLLLEL